jgi:hypothetical protein
MIERLVITYLANVVWMTCVIGRYHTTCQVAPLRSLRISARAMGHGSCICLTASSLKSA